MRKVRIIVIASALALMAGYGIAVVHSQGQHAPDNSQNPPGMPEAATGPLTQRLPGPDRALAVSPTGAYAAAFLSSGTVIVINTTSHAVVSRTAIPGASRAYLTNGLPSAMIFNADGSDLAVGLNGDSGDALTKVVILEVRTGKILESNTIRLPEIHSMAFNPKGETLAVGCGQYLVVLNLTNKSAVAIQERSSLAGDAYFVGFDASGDRLVSAGNPGVLQIYQMPSMTLLQKTTLSFAGASIRDSSQDLEAMVINPQGTVVTFAGAVSVEANQTIPESRPDTETFREVWYWEVKKHRLITAVGISPSARSEGDDQNTSAAYSEDGAFLLTGDSEGEVTIRPASTSPVMIGSVPSLAEGPVTSLALRGDGTELTAAVAVTKGRVMDGVVEQWKLSR